MTDAPLMARFLGQTDLRLVDPLDLTGLATAFDEAANHLRAAARALTSTEERSRAKSGAHPYSAVLPMHDGTDIYVENLTDRELQVLALLASGRTNAAIADMLVISPFTVGNHLRNIYGKLGVSSRSAATRAAVERGLVRGAADAPQSPSRPAQLRMLHPSQSIRNAYSAVARFMPAAS